MEKKRLKANGYVAVCQCGNTVGAIDLNRTDRKESGKILGQWIADGCVLYPQFTATWIANVSPCACEQ